MKSRLEKYYESNNEKNRISKNQQLYRTIYDETEYSNVEGISIIEKNEKIDMQMIKNLINKNDPVEKPKQKFNYEIPIEEDIYENPKSYDIKDVLSKAKDERINDDKKIFDTQYNILKNINIDEEIKAPDIKDGDLKDMIEAISNNSREYTSNLLDDLKSIYDPTLQEDISKIIEPALDTNTSEIDDSFYTSSSNFKAEDFEDKTENLEFSEEKDYLTIILIVILSLVLLFGIIFLIFSLV